MDNILWLVISFGYIFFILCISKNVKKISDEVSRKFAHIAISNIWFVMNHCFSNILISMLIPCFMIAIMAYSEKYNIFSGLKRDDNSISYGTVCYFISMLIMVIIGKVKYNSLIPIGGFFLLLGYGDAFAALCGKKYHVGKYKVMGYMKSISGNIAMFIVSCIVFSIYLKIYNLEYSCIQVIFISFVATIIEALSVKGTDNFTIPILTYFVYELFF